MTRDARGEQARMSFSGLASPRAPPHRSAPHLPAVSRGL